MISKSSFRKRSFYQAFRYALTLCCPSASVCHFPYIQEDFPGRDVFLWVCTTYRTLTMITSIGILAGVLQCGFSPLACRARFLLLFRAAIKSAWNLRFCLGYWSRHFLAANDSLAVFGSICIGLILLVFVNKKSNPILTCLSNCANHDAEVKVRDFLATSVNRSTIKTKRC